MHTNPGITVRKKKLIRVLILFLMMLFAAGISLNLMAESAETAATSASEEEWISDAFTDQKTEAILAGMTLEEKAAQLFVIMPEALTGVQGVTMAGSVTEAAFAQYPVGGILYMENNIQSWDQTSQMLSSMQKISESRIGLPVFLAVDEEGGRVSRISGRLENVPYIPDMYSIASAGDSLQAYDLGRKIGSCLNQIGFNVDFAPVADVLTNPDNSVIGDRAFGSDPKVASAMVSMEITGLSEEGVCSTLKHFPGHGNTSEDSHQGLAVSYRTLEEMRDCEFLPFKSGIEAGAEFVMAGHVATPNVTGDDTPASLSYQMLTTILRGELGFQGIIITDALNMGAIVNAYGAGDAAVKAFEAGADMLLAPGDFQSAYNAVLEAVISGRISQERLEESLKRIIRLKLKMQEDLPAE